MDKVIELAKEHLEGLEYFDNNFFDKFEEKLNTKKGFLYGSTKTNKTEYPSNINPLFNKNSYNITMKEKEIVSGGFNYIDTEFILKPMICTKTTEFIRNNPQSIKLNELGEGSFATVYEIGDDKKYVLKRMKYQKVNNNMKNNEQQNLLKNLFFNYILQLYLSKIKEQNITCNIYEFGTAEFLVESHESSSIIGYLYCIMENGGDSLDTYIINNKNNIKKNNIKTMYKIFKKCASHVNTIHKLGYIHLDIKLQNFLIEDNNNDNDIDTIKIIDFDTILKKNTIIFKEVGTCEYIHFDIYESYRIFLLRRISNPSALKINKWLNGIKVSEKHDIFSLGCLYLYILYNINNNINIKNIMVMPFEELINKKFEKNEYLQKRKNYKEYYKKELNHLMENLPRMIL
jgi:serine/threonine protein kinase